MEVVAGIIFRKEPVGVVGIPERFVKVDAAVDEIGGADEIIAGMPHFLPERSIGPPAAHGKQGAHIDPVTEGTGLGDVILQSLDQLLHGGQVTHGPENIHSGAYRVDDVVDALLDDHRVGAIGGHLMGKPVGTGKTVGFVGQAVVFPKDTGAGGGAADDGGVVIAFRKAPPHRTIIALLL